MKTGLFMAALVVVTPSLTRAQPDTGSHVCANEGGIVVCRNAVSAEPEVVRIEEAPQASKGLLFLLLDIPSNIFARLAAPPEANRKYHPKRTWDYHSKPPAPPRVAGSDRVVRAGGEPVWKYHPKASFKYAPKRNWSYNRDVFGRLWRANILNDTRVIEVPLAEPNIILLPVADAR